MAAALLLLVTILLIRHFGCCGCACIGKLRQARSRYAKSWDWSTWPWRSYSVRELDPDSDQKVLVQPPQGSAQGVDQARTRDKNMLADFYSPDIRKLVEDEMLEDQLAGRRGASEVTVSVRMNKDRHRGRRRERGGYWSPDILNPARSLNK